MPVKIPFTGFVVYTKHEVDCLVSSVAGSSGKSAFIITKAAADLTADGSLWYIDITHGRGSMGYTCQVFDANTGCDILPEKTARTETVIRIWFSYKWPSFTVVVL